MSYKWKSHVRAASHSIELLPNTSEIHFLDPTTTKRSRVMPRWAQLFLNNLCWLHTWQCFCGGILCLPASWAWSCLQSPASLSCLMHREGHWRLAWQEAGTKARSLLEDLKGRDAPVSLHLLFTASHTPCDLPGRHLNVNLWL